MKYKICLFLILATCANASFAHSRVCNDDRVDSILFWMAEYKLDSIPVIIYNEKEITLEEYKELPRTKIGTEKICVPPLSVEILGDKGRRGIVYVNSKMDYVPFPYGKFYQQHGENCYYYENGDLPAEFPGGDDSLTVYLRNTVKVSPELDSIGAGVYVYCYIDTLGNCEKAEIHHIHFLFPDYVDVGYNEGKRGNGNILTSSHKRYLDIMREEALRVASNLPKFTPATFWLRHVPYKKEIRMFFIGKKYYRSEYIY